MSQTMKKALLLVASVAALTALAGPATASAAEWTQGGSPLSKNAGAKFQGTLTFANEKYGGVSCSMTLNSTLKPGNTGTVDTIEVALLTCKKTGLFTVCGGISSVMITSLPLLTAESTSAIKMSNFSMKFNFNGCTLAIAGDLIAYPDNSGNITSIEFNKESGTLATSFAGITMTASGTMAATYNPAGTYGIK